MTEIVLGVLGMLAMIDILFLCMGLPCISNWILDKFGW